MAKADQSTAASAKAKAPNSAKGSRAAKEVGPDDVVRQSAGAYKSGDDRFEIRQSAATWYLVDRTQANEFGQELMHGPFGSLKEATAAIPGARDLKPLLRSAARPSKPVAKKQAAPAPQSWIDKLPDAERRQVRSLIRVLEAEGIKDAEELVRRHRDDTTPTIATRLVEQRLKRLIDDLPDGRKTEAKELVGQVVSILASSGNTVPRPGPRWALMEVVEGEDSSARRINPRS